MNKLLLLIIVIIFLYSTLVISLWAFGKDKEIIWPLKRFNAHTITAPLFSRFFIYISRPGLSCIAFALGYNNKYNDINYNTLNGFTTYYKEL